MARKRGKNGIMTTTASRRTTDRAAGESGRRGGGTRDAWATLQELAGQASLWPRLIRRLFWTRRLRNADRAVLCAFCFVNGVPKIHLNFKCCFGGPCYQWWWPLLGVALVVGGPCWGWPLLSVALVCGGPCYRWWWWVVALVGVGGGWWPLGGGRRHPVPPTQVTFGFRLIRNW